MAKPPPLAARPPRLALRLHFAPGQHMGPGKADLLAAIAATGSIAAAARDMGMSYRRAWSLVEALNQMFESPLVRSLRGGPQHGGAALTPLGAEVLAQFRALEAAAQSGGASAIAALAALAAKAKPAPG